MEVSCIKEKLLALKSSLPGKVGYYVKSLQSNAVISYNEDLVFNPASTIKLLLLCAVLNSARRGQFCLKDRITVNDDVKVGGCGVISELMAGLNPTVRDLLKLMVIISDNTATNMLFDVAGGATALEEYACSLGLKETRLRRKLFDTETEARGINNAATPFELSVILEGLANKTLMHPDDCEEAINMLMRQQLNNKLPSKVVSRMEWYAGTNTVKFAHKTGEQENIEHDVGIVFTPKGKIVVAVMTEDVDNETAVDFIGNFAKEVVDCFVNVD